MRHSNVGLRTLIFLFLSLMTSVLLANQTALLVNYGVHNAEPYTFIKDEQLTDGIIKNVAEELSKRLNITVKFVQNPRKRLFRYLELGRVHMIVMSNPDWFKEAETLSWSIPIMEEKNIFVVSNGNPHQINQLGDLKGKTLGTILGYSYPELDTLFKGNVVIREDARRLQQNFEKLLAGRIDLLVDSDILVNHFIKSNGAEHHFQIANKVSSKHPLRSALSPLSPISIDQLNSAYKDMLEDGAMENILNLYR